MSFRIQQVRSNDDFQAFLDVVDRIYAGYAHYIRPLNIEIRSVFDPKTNPFFEHGEATQFLLMDADNRPAGRVAAFINHQKANNFDVPTGGMGFFECVEDREGAAMLFEAAENWLGERGMQAMDGPINFGENDRNWGLLVDGFDDPPAHGMLYHPPYYREFFETYGFQFYFEQVSKHLDLRSPMPERFQKIRDWAKSRGKITVEFADKGNMPKYERDFRTIYNDAWQFHENFVPMSAHQVHQMVKQLKMIMIEEMTIFAYVNGDPAGFVICLPDLNQIFRRYGGRMGLLDDLTFFWRKRNKFKYYREHNILTRGRVIILGIRPKYQKLGVESVLTIDGYHAIRSLGFETMELGWVGDFNPKMRALLDQVGAEHAKTHYTYRYFFDPERRKEGVRSTIIPMGTKENLNRDGETGGEPMHLD